MAAASIVPRLKAPFFSPPSLSPSNFPRSLGYGGSRIGSFRGRQLRLHLLESMGGRKGGRRSSAPWRERRRGSHVAAMEDGAEGEGEKEDEPEGLRMELGMLQAEMEETQRKANNARVRFIRLTNAVEQLQASAMAAIKAGDEALARRQIEEKARIMEALSHAQSRANTLEALASKLNEAISRKETLLISALASSKASASKGPSEVRAAPSNLGLSLNEIEESEREKSLRIASDEQLKERFLNMERADLERLLKLTTEIFTEGGVQAEEQTSKEDSMQSYLNAVEEQIAQVEGKYARLLKLGSEGDISAAELKVRITTAREMLVQLYQMRDRISAREGARDGDSAEESRRDGEGGEEEVGEESPEESPLREGGTLPMKPAVLSAVEQWREGNVVGAAASLQRWLEGPPSEPPLTLSQMAADYEGAAPSAREAEGLYGAYLKTYVVSVALANVMPSSWGLFGASSADDSIAADIGRLEALLGVPREAALSVRRRVALSAAVDAALSDTADEERATAALARRLEVGESAEGQIREEAEAAGKLKRFIAIVFKELRFSGGSAALNWRDAEWTLTAKNRKDIKWAISSIGVGDSTALAAAAAAARDICEVILEQAVAYIRQRNSSLMNCALELENLIRFVHETAVPTMLLVSDRRERSVSEEIELDQPFGISGGSMNLDGVSADETDEVDPRALIKLLRVKGFRSGGDAEALLSAFYESSYTKMIQNVSFGTDLDEDEDSKRELNGPPVLPGSDTLLAVLGISPSVEKFIAENVSRAVYGAALQRVLDDGWISRHEWAALSLQQRVLGLSEEAALSVRAEGGGALCRKLLNRRNAGADVSPKDLRGLAGMCGRLGITHVAGVDVRDRLFLLRRALQAALDSPTFTQSSPAEAAFEGEQMVAILQRAFNLPPNEVEVVHVVVVGSAASSSLLQARASLQRGQREEAMEDMGRLGLALGLLPKRPEPVQDVTSRVGSEEEAAELYGLYVSGFGRWGEGEASLQQIRYQEMEGEILERVRIYLGVEG